MNSLARYGTTTEFVATCAGGKIGAMCLVLAAERGLRTTEREAWASGTKHADPADQVASEYERQSLAHKAASARQTLKALKEAFRAL